MPQRTTSKATPREILGFVASEDFETYLWVWMSFELTLAQKIQCVDLMTRRLKWDAHRAYERITEGTERFRPRWGGWSWPREREERMSILIELRRIFFAMDLRLKPSRSTPQRLPDYSTVLELKGVYFRIKALTARGDALIRTARDVPLLQYHADELKDRLRSDVYLPLVEVANNVQRFVDVVPGWTPPALAELPERLERARAEFANIQREVRASPSLVIHRTDLNLHDSVISIRDAARGLRFNSTGKLRHKADEIVTIANRFFE